MKCKCDSFPILLDVHFPTDLSLLYDCVKKLISIVSKICKSLDISGWRQQEHLIQKTKKLLRVISKTKHSTSKNEVKRLERENLITEYYRQYLNYSLMLLKKVKSSADEINVKDELILEKTKYSYFLTNAFTILEQIKNRIFYNKLTPHKEKLFSVFQPYVEWIVKGKSGVSQELGINTCIVTDQFGFILHHYIMRQESDSKIVVELIKNAKSKFPLIQSCSFDKGFYSTTNSEELKKILPEVFLPAKGRLSKKRKEIEGTEKFRKARKAHPAVESSIHALKNHGLGRCKDRSIDSFELYVSLGMLARNIEILGSKLLKVK